ncbi:MAG: 1-acyl-sn-glycerol-3-phosphate acyltransferase [Deltaproteobacteria bacterium]|nr:1-acyl-sn-glycerol-3-phosphate acyltransferase [Deltaproteobacteria bacterium]
MLRSERNKVARILDWAATGAAAGGVFSALATFELAQRIAIRLGPHAHQRTVSGMAHAVNLAAGLAGTRFRVEGLEHVAPGRNYVIVSNHQSLLDISMCSHYLRALQPRYISKKELARGIPGVSFNIRRGGSAAIDRKDPEQAHQAIAELARHVHEDGWSVCIFPEGTRSKTGTMRAFRTGGLLTLLANAPGVPVLPVTTSGGSRLFAHGLKPIVRGVELVFRVHPSMTPPDPHDEAAMREFLRAVEETIARGLRTEHA